MYAHSYAEIKSTKQNRIKPHTNAPTPIPLLGTPVHEQISYVGGEEKMRLQKKK